MEVILFFTSTETLRGISTKQTVVKRTRHAGQARLTRCRSEHGGLPIPGVRVGHPRFMRPRRRLIGICMPLCRRAAPTRLRLVRLAVSLNGRRIIPAQRFLLYRIACLFSDHLFSGANLFFQ